MDDDDLRRGRPTCHRAFDEPTAILAGDSLQALAFSILAHHPGAPSDASARVQLIGTLAGRERYGRMAGGQALDLQAEDETSTSPNSNRSMHSRPGALIRASVRMAAICAPDLDAAGREALERFGISIGLAFQVQDDILDVEGDEAFDG